MLISVHIPKCAGTTLLHCLQQKYKVYLDYAHPELLKKHYRPNDPTYAHSAWMRYGRLNALFSLRRLKQQTKGYDCIHGHFCATKYLFYPNAKFITFVREPLERTISNYYFWKQVYESANPEQDQLVQVLFERDIACEEFCMLPPFRNYQSLFLKSFPLRRLDFIGVSEYSSFEIPYLFTHVLDHSADIDVAVLNATKRSDERSKTTRAMDPSFVQKFKAANRIDYRLYEKALKMHDQRRRLESSGPGGCKLPRE